jgi:hypothetical protein
MAVKIRERIMVYTEKTLHLKQLLKVGRFLKNS